MFNEKNNRKAFFTTREAAEILGVSQRTAQLMVESGRLEAWKTPGGHRRISRSALESVLTGRAPEARPAPGDGDDPLSVMVVDPDPGQLRIYRAVLARWPLDVRLTRASDGYEALIRLGQGKPDLLFTELLLPGLDGFRLVEGIRSKAEFSDVTIAVVTSLGPQEILRKGGLPAGVAVFAKPVPFDRLLELALARQAAARGGAGPRGDGGPMR